jgi:hypothetical protein
MAGQHDAGDVHDSSRLHAVRDLLAECDRRLDE